MEKKRVTVCHSATAQRFYTVKRVQQENFATHSRIRLRMEFGRE